MATKWLSIADYSKRTGMSRSVIKQKIKNNDIVWETTDGGGKYLIKYEENDDVQELKERMGDIEKNLKTLMVHLGVKEAGSWKEHF